MKLVKIVQVACVMLMALFCVACGPNNTVPLTYTPKSDAVLPSPNAPRVAVVLFEDTRTETHLGLRNDNTTFVGTSSVPEWVSRSFAEGLRSKGLQVSFAETLSQAQSGAPAYIVTGKIREASLREQSVAELRASMQVEISVHDAQGVLLKEGLSASQSETGIISTSTATALLQSTVQEMLRPGVDKVAEISGVN